MKKWFKYLIVFTLGMTVSFAQDNKALASFSKANECYKKGDYHQAIMHYEAIENLDLQAFEVYYNLGNCFFKTNQLAPAIYNYEKALLLEPNDNDIQINLNLAYDKVKNFENETPSSLQYLFSSSIFFYILIGLVVNILFFGITYYQTKYQLFKKLTWAFSCLSLLLIFFRYLSYTATDTKKAIVFADKTGIKTADLKENIKTLYSGSKVYVLEEKGNMLKVETTDHIVGYIDSKSVKVIN